MLNEQQQLADELHKAARRNFVRRRTVSLFRDDLWQADLVEMFQDFNPKFNQGYRYILMVIDTFTRFGFAKPLKNKAGTTVALAFESIISENKSPPKLLHTDRGKEFYCSPFQEVVKKYGIKHYSTFTEKKAAICERFNRTIKSQMWKKLTEINSNIWINILPDLLEQYNNRKHSTIGLSPYQARLPKNTNWVRRQLAVSKTTIRKAKFKVGDQVRISKLKGIFEKGYKPNWSEEVFIIHKVKNTNPRTYIIKDQLKEIIEGCFYEQELQKPKLENYYRIEKVLRRRKNQGVDEILVRWMGHDSPHDSWIKSSNTYKL